MIRNTFFSFVFIFSITTLFGQEIILETDALKPSYAELEAKVKSLQYTELFHSMSQRSLLTPNYFAQRKALIARQAYNFWMENSAEKYVSHLDIYSALYDANKYFDYDSINDTYYNQIIGHNQLVVATEFGNDPNAFYSAGSDGKVLKWDFQNSSNPPIVLFQDRFLYRSLDVSFDDKWLLAVTKENGVLLISTSPSVSAIDNEVQYATVSQDPEIAQTAIFIPDELKYLTINKQGEIKIKGYGIDSVQAHTEHRVRTLAINNESKDIYAGTVKGVVQVWNEKFDERYLDIPELYAVNILAVSSDQKLLAIGREKGDAIIWDMEEKKIIRIISGHQSAITDIDFSPDDRLLLTASRDRTVRVWDIYETKKFPLVLSDHNDWVMTACFDKTGKNIITGSKDKSIRIFSLDFNVLAERICDFATRNMTPEEWNDYVGEDIGYQETCPIQKIEE